MYCGKVAVEDGAMITIPIRITNRSARTFDAALWWPEYAQSERPDFRFLQIEPHSDIDLWVVDPEGRTRAASVSTNGVFERCRVNGPLTTGTWTIRIVGLGVPFVQQQPVYWAAYVRR